MRHGPPAISGIPAMFGPTEAPHTSSPGRGAAAAGLCLGTESRVESPTPEADNLGDSLQGPHGARDPRPAGAPQASSGTW